MAHLRRGDLASEHIKWHVKTARLTSDEWYLNVLAALAQALAVVAPDAQVEFHALTSCTGAYCDVARTTTMHKFGAHNVHLHVDDEGAADESATQDVVRSWAHLIKADILLLSKSSFSYVPALFNQGCVLYEPFWHPSFPSWVTLGENFTGEECLDETHLKMELFEANAEPVDPRCTEEQKGQVEMLARRLAREIPLCLPLH